MADRITELWAFVAVEPNGEEGLPPIQSGRVVLPMIGADAERVRSLRPHAEAYAARTGYPISLRRFVLVEELERIVR